jgi:hypothetical protein
MYGTLFAVSRRYFTLFRASGVRMLRQRIVGLCRAPLLEWRRRSYYTGPVVPLDQIKEEMGGYGGGSVELTREIVANPA